MNIIPSAFSLAAWVASVSATKGTLLCPSLSPSLGVGQTGRGPGFCDFSTLCEFMDRGTSCKRENDNGCLAGMAVRTEQALRVRGLAYGKISMNGGH